MTQPLRPDHEPVVRDEAARGAPSRWRHLLLVMVLVGVVWAGYHGVFDGQEFVWDDHEYVVVCSWLDGFSADNLRSILLEPWMGNHHPLTMLSLALDRQIGGLDASVFKRTNLVLHAVNVGLVYLVIWLLWRGQALAFVTALLFAIHPTRVESVAWISERKDVLFACFYLLGTVAYVTRGRDRGRVPWHLGLAFLAFVLSAASKPMAVSFPLVLLIIDALRREITRRRIIEKIPFFALAGVMALVTLQSQQPVIRENPSLIERGLLSVQALGLYLEKLVWPHPLSALYARPRDVGLSFEGVLGCGLLMATGMAWVLVARARRASVRGGSAHGVSAGGVASVSRMVALGLTAFLIMILPVLHVVSFGDQLAADRYTYLSYVPLFVLGGYPVAWWVGRAGAKHWVRGAAGLSVFLLVALALGVLTDSRVRVWKNDRTLFEAMLDYDRSSFVAHTWLGTLARSGGRPAEAERHLRAALDALPGYPNALLGLALLERDRGHYAAARELLEEVVAKQPRWNHAWASLGRIDDLLGRRAESRQAYERALEIEPKAAIALIGLATHAVRDRRLEEGLDYLRRALEIRPRAWRTVERLAVLAPLRKRPECARLIDEAKARDAASGEG